jgi:hypothetical protein
MIGSIPENITYIWRGTEDVKFNFDEFEEDAAAKSTTVKPTFPADSSVEKTVERGKDWAKNRYRATGPVEDITRKNEPFEGLRLITLEKRAEGGRAWKVIDRDGHYFDLREDVLLDTLLTVGTKPNGELNGKFLWAKVGSQTKLIRYSSALHNRMLEGTRRASLAKLPLSEIVPGGVYMTKGQKIQICLGSPKGKAPFIFFNPYLLKYRADKKDFLKELKSGIKDSHYWSFTIIKSPNFIEKIEDIKLPKNILQQVRELGTRYNNTALASMLVQVTA